MLCKSQRRLACIAGLGIVISVPVVLGVCAGPATGISAFASIATLSAVLVALFSEWIVIAFLPARLRLTAGRPTLALWKDRKSGERVGKGWFFGLYAVNERLWPHAKNCQVYLRALYRPNGKDGWEAEPLSGRLPFRWGLSRFMPERITVTSQGWEVAFGSISKPDKAPSPTPFEPTLLTRTFNFEHRVQAGQRAIFKLQPFAENGREETFQYFEVSWDGEWTEDPIEIKRHVQIREVTQEWESRDRAEA